MYYRTTDPKLHLETLAACQEDLESLLYRITGLTVKVSLNVHTADNSTDDLLRLLEASRTLPDFKQVITSGRTWIAHKDIGRNIFVFMPKDFDADELYPEPEDNEGYAQAVENASYQRLEGQHTPTDLGLDDEPF